MSTALNSRLSSAPAAFAPYWDPNSTQSLGTIMKNTSMEMRNMWVSAILGGLELEADAGWDGCTLAVRLSASDRRA